MDSSNEKQRGVSTLPNKVNKSGAPNEFMAEVGTELGAVGVVVTWSWFWDSSQHGRNAEKGAQCLQSSTCDFLFM